MASNDTIWNLFSQYVTQIVFMIGIVFAAAKWIDKKNKENVSGLRQELIGDKEHVGIIPRLEMGFGKSIEQVQKDFAISLNYAEKERNRLEDEIERLRNIQESERYDRRGRSVRYDAKGDPR